jgi:hypothetical protein
MEKMQLKYERLSLKNITYQHIFIQDVSLAIGPKDFLTTFKVIDVI